MPLPNLTLGQLERLALLGCPVVIRDGLAYAPAFGPLLARLGGVLLALRARSLRRYWRDERRIDWMLGCGREGFDDTYYATRFQCLDELGSRWFRRA